MHTPTLLLITAIFTMMSCSSSQSVIAIPAKQSVEIDYPGMGQYTASLRNKGANDINISVRSKVSDEQMKGFGLGRSGTADIVVEPKNKLVVTNGADRDAKIAISIRASDKKPNQNSRQVISFTLANTTSESIPLIIPSVMNPNLSPYSRSGVDLRIGQEIYFRAKGKKRLLLRVDDSISDGDTLDVAKLIQERRQELGM